MTLDIMFDIKPLELYLNAIIITILLGTNLFPEMIKENKNMF